MTESYEKHPLPTFLFWGSNSPVNAAWSIETLTDSVRWQYAGTITPISKEITSPGTKWTPQSRFVCHSFVFGLGVSLRVPHKLKLGHEKYWNSGINGLPAERGWHAFHIYSAETIQYDGWASSSMSPSLSHCSSNWNLFCCPKTKH